MVKNEIKVNKIGVPNMWLNYFNINPFIQMIFLFSIRFRFKQSTKDKFWETRYVIVNGHVVLVTWLLPSILFPRYVFIYFEFFLGPFTL